MALLSLRPMLCWIAGTARHAHNREELGERGRGLDVAVPHLTPNSKFGAVCWALPYK